MADLTPFPGVASTLQDERKLAFLGARRNGATMTQACKVAGISDQTYYDWKADDSIFLFADARALAAWREDRVKKHAESANLLRDTGEMMAKGLLVEAAGGSGESLDPKKMAKLARDKDARAGLDLARKMIIDASGLDRVSHDLPANGPGAGTTVNVAAHAHAAAMGVSQTPPPPPAGADAARPETFPASTREFVERDLGAAVMPIAKFYPRLEWLLDRAEATEVKTVVLDVGKGSGKGVLAAVFLARRLREALAHPLPAQEYGLLPNAGIGVVNLSVTGNQAQLAIFADLRELIGASPWFQRLRPKVSEASGKIEFGTQRVIAFSGCGDATGVEGYAWIAAVVDEVDRLPETASHGGKRADDLVDPVENTMLTRIGARRKLLVMSWPEHEESYIQRRVQRAVESGILTDLTAEFLSSPLVRDDPGADAARKTALLEKPFADYPAEVYLTRDGTLVVHAPTWQLKPDADLAEFATALDTRPFQAARMIGARPQRSGANPFVRDLEMVRRGANPARAHPVTEDGRWADWFRGSPEHLYYAHIDAAVSGDAAGMAVGHFADGKVVIDLMLEVQPPKGGQINLQGLRDRVYEMRERGFDVVWASNDGWEGWSCRQDFEGRGIKGAVYSVDRTRDPYECWLMLHQKGLLDYYDYAPYTECAESLQDMTKKVDHRPGGKKDVTDAVAAVCKQLWDKYGNRRKMDSIL